MKQKSIMINKQIIKDNIIIAKFMGWNILPFEKRYALDGWYYGINSKGKRYNGLCAISKNNCWLAIAAKVKYHSSWDWLMPVVEKIESLDYKVDIFYKYAQVSTMDEDFICRSFAINHSKIQEVWEMVVKFIKWYNKQNKQYDNK
jgi:hypothetical protein